MKKLLVVLFGVLLIQGSVMARFDASRLKDSPFFIEKLNALNDAVFKFSEEVTETRSSLTELEGQVDDQQKSIDTLSDTNLDCPTGIQPAEGEVYIDSVDETMMHKRTREIVVRWTEPYADQLGCEITIYLRKDGGIGNKLRSTFSVHSSAKQLTIDVKDVKKAVFASDADGTTPYVISICPSKSCTSDDKFFASTEEFVFCQGAACKTKTIIEQCGEDQACITDRLLEEVITLKKKVRKMRTNAHYLYKKMDTEKLRAEFNSKDSALIELIEALLEFEEAKTDSVVAVLFGENSLKSCIVDSRSYDSFKWCLEGAVCDDKSKSGTNVDGDGRCKEDK